MRISSAVIISTLCTHLTTVASAQTEIVATEHLPGRVVEVEAGEFFLRAPDTISAGLVTLRLRQIGDLLTDRAKAEAENLAPATPDNDPTPATDLPRTDIVAYITGTGQVRLEGTVHSGRQSIMVINNAPKSYEFMVHRLRPGRTADDAVSWERTDGTPHPFASQGGLSDIPPGATRLTTIAFAAGNYVIWTIRSPATSVAVTIPES